MLNFLNLWTSFFRNCPLVSIRVFFPTKNSGSVNIIPINFLNCFRIEKHCLFTVLVVWKYLHFEMLPKSSRIDSKRSSIIRLLCIKCTPLSNEALYNPACGAKRPQEAIERNQCTLNSLIGSTRALSPLLAFVLSLQRSVHWYFRHCKRFPYPLLSTF